MNVIGLICAFQEEIHIRFAVESLLAGGVDRVVVVDGAWENPDGTPFGGGHEWQSSDETMMEAARAGAEFVVWPDRGGDSDKLDWAIHHCGAKPGDHILRIDADERLSGRIDPAHSPSGHGCVILHNRENDLPGIRTSSLDGAVRETVPLLRWLRYSDDLRCDAPGRYLDGTRRVEPYLVGVLRVEAERPSAGQWLSPALAALSEVEQFLPDHLLSALPIVPGIEIHHQPEPRTDRILAKVRYYVEAAA